jgi:DNA polymerase
MLLDLIEHLEVIPGFKLVQSNTDGLIVWIPDTDEAFDMLDDICYEWECRCSTDLCEIGLALDCIQEIIQKDVNNYLWIDAEGGVERIGAYVKELSDLDNDLPIVNEALVNLFTKKIPLADTIYGCNEVKKFQKIVKLSNKYEYVGHECGNPEQGRGKNLLVYTTVKRYDYKCYRVFASSDMRDGRLLKFKSGKKGEKFANTPEHCFIYNDDVTKEKVPKKLDKQYYIDIANVRLHDKKKGFGL